MRYRCHAKVNMTLSILGRRGDGYHTIRSIFQAVALHDDLAVERSSSGIGLEVRSPFPGIPSSGENLVIRAVREVMAHRGVSCGLEMVLTKRIPPGAGLGGGSSDAFAAIRALDGLLSLELTEDEYLEIAARIGSDVPYFYYGGTAMVTGRGEHVTPLADFSDREAVIVMPPRAISSKDAYRWWDERSGSSHQALQDARSCATLPDEASLVIGNDFEEVIFSRYHEIAHIKEKLLALGCEAASLTGSGSAVVGYHREKGRLRDFAGAFSGECLVIPTTTLRRSQCMT
ncbi:MAG: 4-(cytidine 5'-diphospho)-2-C-methyl-D-erythritol kinase [Candidatus Eremiobacteraeota bacterium]|nr:4-(cytidine 5'-diphospho)-2-C-methyl-D-erythritol kinase [Candidatus Eremiobacteraeota bacterium]